MKKPRKRTKPNRYHHGNLRPVLLEAAEEVLEADGVEAVQLAKIADLVGVTESAPYNYFKTRKNLLVAIAAEGFSRIRIDFMNALSPLDASDHDGRLHALAQTYLDFALRQPQLFTLMFSDLVAPYSEDPKLLEASSSAYGIIVETISNLMDHSSTHPIDTMAKRSASVAGWGLAYGVTMLLVDDVFDLFGIQVNSPNDLLEHAVDIYIASIRDTG